MCQFASWKQCVLNVASPIIEWSQGSPNSPKYTCIHMIVHMWKSIQLILTLSYLPHKMSHMWWGFPGQKLCVPWIWCTPPPPTPTHDKTILIFDINSYSHHIASMFVCIPVCIDMGDINSWETIYMAPDRNTVFSHCDPFEKPVVHCIPWFKYK